MKRFSRQRATVLDAVISTTCHPTAEWVYQEVRKIMPKISLGTVYRDLADLKAENLIVGFTDSEGVEHFDGCTGPHIHFICNECGEILDIMEDSTKEMRSSVAEAIGADMTDSVVILKGICKKCKEKK